MLSIWAERNAGYHALLSIEQAAYTGVISHISQNTLSKERRTGNAICFHCQRECSKWVALIIAIACGDGPGITVGFIGLSNSGRLCGNSSPGIGDSSSG